MVKIEFSSCESRKVAASNLPEKHTDSFFSSFSTTALVKYLSFLKERGCLSLLAGKSSDITILPYQGDNRYGRQQPSNILPDISSHGMVLCVLGVFYTALKLQENFFFGTCELGPNGKISIFPCETWILVVSNLPEKHTDSFFSSLQQHWSSIWVFWKK